VEPLAGTVIVQPLQLSWAIASVWAGEALPGHVLVREPADVQVAGVTVQPLQLSWAIGRVSVSDKLFVLVSKPVDVQVAGVVTDHSPHTIVMLLED